MGQLTESSLELTAGDGERVALIEPGGLADHTG